MGETLKENNERMLKFTQIYFVPFLGGTPNLGQPVPLSSFDEPKEAKMAKGSDYPNESILELGRINSKRELGKSEEEPKEKIEQWTANETTEKH